jgi:hypothetical protein
MNHRQSILLIRKITGEYVNFMKTTSVLVKDVKRATVFALKKTLKLKDGELVLINEDGSVDITPVNKNEEETMPEDKGRNSEKAVLNGREVTLEELERQKEAAKLQKGARLEEVSKGNFRLHLNG